MRPVRGIGNETSPPVAGRYDDVREAPLLLQFQRSDDGGSSGGLITNDGRRRRMPPVDGDQVRAPVNTNGTLSAA